MVLRSFKSAFATKDFINGIKPINAPRIHKPMLGVKNLMEVIWTSPIHVEIKLHILLVKLKILMLLIFLVSIKK